MAKGIALGVFLFSLSISLVGGFFGVGDMDMDTQQVQDNLEQLDNADGLIESTNQAIDLTGNLLSLVVPSTTGVLWFDLLVFGGITFGIGLFLIDITPVIG